MAASKPKVPPPPPPVKQPVRDDAKIAAEVSDRMRARKGRAATILTDAQRGAPSANISAKTKLGS